MKAKMMTVLSLLTITSSAYAGSDTVTCGTASGSIQFSVGNGSHLINIKVKDKRSGKFSNYQAAVKLLPGYDYNVPEADQVVTALPVGTLKMIKSDNAVMAVYTKTGKLKCTGREFTDETYRQKMLLTLQKGRLENQGFFAEFDKDQVVPGLDASSGFITADFNCHHEAVSTAGGCFIDDNDGDTAVEERQK